MPSGALVMLSGGPDSLAAAGWSLSSGMHTEALFINAGQLVGSAELDCAQDQAKYLGIQLHQLDVSSLTRGMREIGSPGESIFKGAGLPLLPFSAEIAISIAFSAARTLRLGSVVFGLHSGDAHHPDYANRSLEAMAVVAGQSNHGVELTLPFRGLSKREVIAYGIGRGLPMANTWSCISNAETHCGSCLPCEQRIAAFSTIPVAEIIA